MLSNTKLENIICIDIETVSEKKSISELDSDLKELYLNKSLRLKIDGEDEEAQYGNHAAIYAEFGKIVCISVGIFSRSKKDEPRYFRIKSFANDDETELLTQFATLLNKFYNDDKYVFAGHNIKEFDLPFLCRRLLIHQIELPKILNISGKKPYEINHIDTLYQWRFGDYKHYTSLKLLTKILNIPSSKDDIEGKDVGKVYWVDNDLKRIVEYCQKDVLCIAQLILRFKYMDLLKTEDVKFVD